MSKFGEWPQPGKKTEATGDSGPIHERSAEEEVINACLESRRVGFEEISVMGTEQLFQMAPQGETFIVPDERFKNIYENRAKSLEREDLKFLIVE